MGMSREEHIYQLKQYLQGKSISMCPSSSLYWQEHWEEVIKALEQEPILDKIRVEVENINVWGMRYNPDTDKDRKPQIVQKVKEHVIEIIDKYKAESEVDNGTY